MSTLYEWFARSARAYPDAVALEVAGRCLTYRDLHGCAAGVAERMLGAYGRPPARVGLLASRSLVAFAGYLAAARLGATVVPLNPDHPVRRNRLIAEAAGAGLLLSDESGLPQLDAGREAGLDGGLDGAAGTVLRLADDDVVAGERAARGTAGEPPERPGDPDGVAYALFTSGSTGRPKGVPIKHRQLHPYIAHNIARYAVAPGCRMSHTFDLTFDPSVFDLFVTWGGGATLVCPQRAELLSPVDYLVERRISHWFSVPSVVSVGAELGNLPAGRATGVRCSIFIGEPLSYRQAAAWQAVAPASTIDNVYGPTELTVACTEYRLPADPDRWPVTSNDTVPIGPVYPYLDHVVLDGEGHRAPEGELCVRGVQRFDGYLDPTDNRDRFVAADGARFAVVPAGAAVEPGHYYRTGDRIRLEDGHLVHLGRLDHQVKIRGYRVELGEVEAVLARHPEVRQAVVVAVSAAGEIQLAACYSGVPVPDRQLVRWLRDRLPMHMVPRRFHHCATMPLNANGKTDRRALHDLVLAGTARRPPAGPTVDAGTGAGS
ncbi:MAG TPA: AMP-binding protein [Micromonosporaceae bacterium]|nr:AMP-binding protein [Micromonosporaceae bacterium]